MRPSPMPAMRLLLDDSLPSELAADLRAAGVEVRTLADVGHLDPPNTLLMRFVHQEGVALLSLDEGIADVRRFPPAHYAGLILLRPPSAGRTALRTFVGLHLPALRQLPLAGRLFIVGPNGAVLQPPV